MQQSAALVAVLAAAVLLAGCDDARSPEASSSAAAVTSPPAVTGLDPCLVGSWRSTGISGSLTIGTAKIPVSGGAGELLTISASGTIRTDEGSTAQVSGASPDGTQYVLRQTGVATGQVTGSGGRISVTLDQPTSLTVTLLRNGTQVQSQHPGSASDTYACLKTSSLTITGGGGTVTTYTPG